jgi:hypothetical protein
MVYGFTKFQQFKANYVFIKFWVVLKELLLKWSKLLHVQTLFLCSTVWHTYEIEKGQNIIKNFKRHSDGTFTNDFTHYLDKIKAKDFVEWLTSNSRVGVVERQVGEYMEIHGKVCSAFPLLDNSSCLPHVNRLHRGQRSQQDKLIGDICEGEMLDVLWLDFSFDLLLLFV